MFVISRLLTTLTVVLSMLAPNLGVGLSAFSDDTTTIVVCSGDGLVSITLDSDGNPVEDSQEQLTENCLMGNALSPDLITDPAWVKFVADHSDAFIALPHLHSQEEAQQTLRDSRAPPVLI